MRPGGDGTQFIRRTEDHHHQSEGREHLRAVSPGASKSGVQHPGPLGQKTVGDGTLDGPFALRPCTPPVYTYDLKYDLEYPLSLVILDGTWDSYRTLEKLL
jgi:hypothetical protein